MEDLKFKSTNL